MRFGKLYKHQTINKVMNFSPLKILSLFFILTQTAYSQDLWAISEAQAIVNHNALDYTIGQITYRDKTQKPKSTLGDVQYAYDIFNLNLNDKKEDSAVKLFPDPTSSFLVLEVANYNYDNLSYQITDMHGKTLETSQIKRDALNKNRTQVDVILLPISSYILNVFEADRKLESFKIIKTNKY